MIDIVRIEHIAVAAHELDTPIDLLEGLFGFRLAQKFASNEGYIGATLDIPGGRGLQWEILAPSGAGSYLYRYLGGPHGAGLHHLSIRVPDAAAAVEALREDEVAPWGLAEGEMPAPGATFYIHPSTNGHGFLYQIESGEPEGPRRVIDPSEDQDERTIGIVAVNHLSHADVSLEELGDWYERVLGMHTIYRSPGDGLETGFATRVLESARFPLRFEAIQPSTPASYIQRFLERRGPGMHHIAFEVGDWGRAVNACALSEVPIFGERYGETDGVQWREAFIHPRYTGGVLVQLFWQAAPGVWI